MSEPLVDVSNPRKRIEQLLARANGAGSTEDEKAFAMKMAMGLMAKYGIEQSNLPGNKPKIAEKNKFQFMKPYEALCAEAAALLYGVECHAPNFGKHGFHYIGREENVELAEQLSLWLVEQVEALYKLALPKGLTVRARADFRASFKDACGERIKQRASDLRRDIVRNEQAAQEATGHNALVVLGHFQLLRQEINDHYRAISDRHEEQRKQQEQQRLEARVQRLASMSEEERVELLAGEERERQRRAEADAKADAAWEKKWARRKPSAEPRQRSLRRGTGTEAGRRAGDQVRLRDELTTAKK